MRKVLKEEAESTDPTFWEKLMRHYHEKHQEDVAKTMDNGKRINSRYYPTPKFVRSLSES